MGAVRKGARSWLAGVAAAVAVALAGPAGAADRDDGPVVAAPAGSVRGVARDGLHVFKGLPYAAAPVGDARWRPPARAARWDGVREARDFGPPCVQPVPRRDNIYAEDLPAMSEDCLSLNIWAPANAARAPVFVWIHGGALSAGASGMAMYDGGKLAHEGMIVVSINYRLGVLGYLAHPGLSAESPERISGNYGLLDQVAALEWVRDNIAAFGGDPANVTIAGESAGALSVLYLMASPRARGLFAKAIAQSAYMVTTPALRERRFGMLPAETMGSEMAAKLGAASVADLRAIDAARLVADAPGAGFFPWGAVDEVVLPRQLVDTFDRGEQAPVPVLTGFNSGEIRSLRMLLPPRPAGREAYEATIRAAYGDVADYFLRFYPADTIDESMLAATRDAMYGWTSERLVRRQAERGVPTYLYIFDHGYPAADAYGLHAFHASELPCVFGTTDRTPPLWPRIPGTSTERRLSEAMRGYWASFARTGRPTAERQPDWPAFQNDGAYMYFAEGPQVAHNLLPGRYQLHEHVVCRRRVAGDIPWNWNVGLASPPLPPQAPECQ